MILTLDMHVFLLVIRCYVHLWGPIKGQPLHSQETCLNFPWNCSKRYICYQVAEDACMYIWDLQVTWSHKSLSQSLWVQPYLKHTCHTVVIVKHIWCRQMTGVLGSLDVLKLLMQSLWLACSGGFMAMYCGWQTRTSKVVLINRMCIVGVFLINTPLKIMVLTCGTWVRLWSSLFLCMIILILAVSRSKFMVPFLMVLFIMRATSGMGAMTSRPAAIISSKCLFVTRALTCRSQLFSVIRMIPVMTTKGAPQNDIPFCFTMAIKILLGTCFGGWSMWLEASCLWAASLLTACSIFSWFASLQSNFP